MNKKGVSPIIATLLLIVIAVAAAVVTYAFVTGFIGTAGTGATGQTGSMTVDSVYVQNNQSAIAYVRNSGQKALTIGSAYVDGQLVTDNCAAVPLAVSGSAVPMQLNFTALSVGAHQLRIVADDGTPVQVTLSIPA